MIMGSCKTSHLGKEMLDAHPVLLIPILILVGINLPAQNFCS